MMRSWITCWGVSNVSRGGEAVGEGGGGRGLAGFDGSVPEVGGDIEGLGGMTPTPRPSKAALGLHPTPQLGTSKHYTEVAVSSPSHQWLTNPLAQGVLPFPSLLPLDQNPRSSSPKEH